MASGSLSPTPMAAVMGEEEEEENLRGLAWRRAGRRIEILEVRVLGGRRETVVEEISLENVVRDAAMVIELQRIDESVAVS